MSRQTTIWALAALLGIVLTAAITWGTSQLTSQRIGISSEPVSAASGLAPRQLERHVTRGGGRSRPKRQSGTQTASPPPLTPTATGTAPPPATPLPSEPAAPEPRVQAPPASGGSGETSVDDGGSGSGSGSGGGGGSGGSGGGGGGGGGGKEGSSGHGRDD